nr:chromate transporter [Ktedonobacteraceae bacterium]
MAAQFDGQRYRTIAAVFLRLGIIGFGGPLAHIGLMEDQCVVRRKWLSREAFLWPGWYTPVSEIVVSTRETSNTREISAVRAISEH